MSINTRLYPTNITLVRQAIIHAINGLDIIQKAFFGDARQIVGPEYTGWKQFYDLGNETPYQVQPDACKTRTQSCQRH